MDALGAERLRLGGRVELDYDLEEGNQLDASAAIACGLIVNEALTNSFKHGFPDGRSGHVRLGLRHLDRSENGSDDAAPERRSLAPPRSFRTMGSACRRDLTPRRARRR